MQVKNSDYWIMNGNCLDHFNKIPDNSIHLTVTSPPYDNLRKYNGSVEWNEDVWKQILQQLYRVTCVGGVVVWIVGDATINKSETGTSFRQALFAMECGFRLHSIDLKSPKGKANVESLKTLTLSNLLWILKNKPDKLAKLLTRNKTALMSKSRDVATARQLLPVYLKYNKVNALTRDSLNRFVN